MIGILVRDGIIVTFFCLSHFIFITINRQFDQARSFKVVHPLRICRNFPSLFLIFFIIFHQACQHISKDTFLTNHLFYLRNRRFFYFSCFFGQFKIYYHSYFPFFIFPFKAFLFCCHYYSFVQNLMFETFSTASFFVL